MFYELFLDLERCGILDPNNDVQLWCLHYVFLPVINNLVFITLVENIDDLFSTLMTIIVDDLHVFTHELYFKDIPSVLFRGIFKHVGLTGRAQCQLHLQKLWRFQIPAVP